MTARLKPGEASWGRRAGRTPSGPGSPVAPGLRRQRPPAHGRASTPVPARHPRGRRSRWVHTPRRIPHFPAPLPPRPTFTPLTSPHSHLPTPPHISPHLPTHILEPPVRPDAKPATARRLGSHVPCGPKSGVDPPRCFAGGALFRVGPHSLPVSATAHAAPPSLPSLLQQLLSQASPRHLPGISPAASHEVVRASLAPPTHPPDTLAGAGEPAGDGDMC